MSEEYCLAHRIKEARDTKGLSDAALANRVGVKLKTYQNWETGKTEPRANKLQMLAGVLGVPLLWLIQGAAEHDPVVDQTSRLDQLEAKLDRLIALQREVAQLTTELAGELASIRHVERELDELAA